ncbi:MAG TPA: hypothetical protein VHI11_06300, partial [Jiangellaceae bacterium]|nr:hypothetical protein [Jiangellaceae bacterium]
IRRCTDGRSPSILIPPYPAKSGRPPGSHRPLVSWRMTFDPAAAIVVVVAGGRRGRVGMAG